MPWSISHVYISFFIILWEEEGRGKGRCTPRPPWCLWHISICLQLLQVLQTGFCFVFGDQFFPNVVAMSSH